MKAIIIEPHYLGSLEYYTLLARSKKIYIDSEDTYRKQTYRNRSYFLTASGVQSIHIPVKYSAGMRTKDVKIDYSQRWVKDHWGAFYSSYGKAPFFEYFSDEFYAIWDKKIKFLLDLNLTFMTKLHEIIRIDVEMTFDSIGNIDYEIDDFRNQIIPKQDFSIRGIYAPQGYTQLFGDQFQPNMSILDMFMCVGPESSSLLSASYLKNGVS